MTSEESSRKRLVLSKPVRAGIGVFSFVSPWPLLLIIGLLTTVPNESLCQEENVEERLAGLSLAWLDKSGQFTPAAYKGEYLLLLFWKTDCAECEFQVVYYEKLFERLRDGRITRDGKAPPLRLVSISVGFQKPAEIKSFMEKNSYEFPVAVDQNGRDTRELFELKGKGLPLIVLIGKDGKIKKEYLGFSKRIEERVLKEIE